jgi:hypothetical protein
MGRRRSAINDWFTNHPEDLPENDGGHNDDDDSSSGYSDPRRDPENWGADEGETWDDIDVVGGGRVDHDDDDDSVDTIVNDDAGSTPLSRAISRFYSSGQNWSAVPGFSGWSDVKDHSKSEVVDAVRSAPGADIGDVSWVKSRSWWDDSDNVSDVSEDSLYLPGNDPRQDPDNWDGDNVSGAEGDDDSSWSDPDVNLPGEQGTDPTIDNPTPDNTPSNPWPTSGFSFDEDVLLVAVVLLVAGVLIGRWR